MKLLDLCGPTATGKTNLALELAKKFDGELVSADSRQVYKGMNIGTGKDLGSKFVVRSSWFVVKIDKKEYTLPQYLIKDVPVWMYDVVNPNEEFNAYHYQILARKVLEDIWQRGKLPILIGGSGLYIDVALGRLELSKVISDHKLRDELNKWSLSQLQAELQNKYPSVWEKLNNSDRQNPRRLIRKIEILTLSFIRLGLGVSSAKRGQGKDFKANILAIGLMADLPELYKRIDARVGARVKAGIIGEIQGLLDNGYDWNNPGMNTLGYKEWKEYFNKEKGIGQKEKEFEKREIIKRWKWDEHGYGRRQMTWFRKNKNIIWVNICGADYANKVEAIVHKWYTAVNESK